MFKFSLCLILFSILGCTSMPGMLGYIEYRTSQFDGTNELVMEHQTVGNRTSMGFSWKSTFPKDELILDLIITGAEHIAPGESLHLNIDGDKIHLVSFDETTKVTYVPGLYNSVASIPGHNESSKRYKITKQLLERLASAKSAIYKVDLDRTYLEGNLKNSDYYLTDPFQSYLKEFNRYQK